MRVRRGEVRAKDLTRRYDVHMGASRLAGLRAFQEVTVSLGPARYLTRLGGLGEVR